jgi:hypothetical protein
MMLVHSHNLRLKVYLVITLVISYVKKIILVMYFRGLEIFCKKRSCIVIAKKPKAWDKKHFFPKNLKEATNDYILYV